MGLEGQALDAYGQNMGGHSPSDLSGGIQLALALGIPALAFVVMLSLGRLAALMRRLASDRHRGTPMSPPLGPPIGNIARDLRRLARELATVTPGATQLGRPDLQREYDEALIAACTALEVGHRLSAGMPGRSRDMERARVEAALAESGLHIHRS